MKICILGGGVAGLSTAYFLNGRFHVEVHEATPDVGGLARSFQWHGFDCDLAPHRFFTNDPDLLREMLALVPMHRIRRRSRIYLRGKWIGDPVNAAELLLKFLPVHSTRILSTYLFRTKVPEDNFEALVLSKYGTGLNDFFFKPYAEKLFGIPASEISAAWGRRKIRVSGLRDLLTRNSRLYFKYFHYPVRHGYGAIADRLYREVAPLVQTQSRLTGLQRNPDTGGYACHFSGPAGSTSIDYDIVVSSMPISDLAALLGFEVRVRFRPAKLVYLLVDRPRVSDAHWLYFADRDMIVNRVAEFKNFADEDVPKDQTVLCCEVTDLHSFSIDGIISQLAAVGLVQASWIRDVKVIDLRHAYPIYDRAYEHEIAAAQEFFAGHPNLYHVGRQAQFVHKDVDEIFEEARRVAAVIAERAEGLATANAALLAAASSAPLPGAAAV
jgi:protoporphyrinogen oxidase